MMARQLLKNMFQNMFQNVTIATTLTLATATTTLAQLPIPTPTLPIRPSFTCAPHLDTYVVRPLDQRRGTGIRCVKRSEGQPGNSKIPAIAWYGEGNWADRSYRHVGHAFYQGRSLTGAAADFKEEIHNNFPFGSLKLEIVDGNTIRVTGAWNEVWTKVNRVAYSPLRRPTTCGGYFDEYKVQDRDGRRRGEGMRCVLRSEHLPPELRGEVRLPLVKGVTTWFGNGYWGDRTNTYSHLGTFSFNGYGASDICTSPFGPICNTFGWGSLRFSPTASGYTVTGAWNERWSR